VSDPDPDYKPEHMLGFVLIWTFAVIFGFIAASVW
jgi:hypothetical protein